MRERERERESKRSIFETFVVNLSNNFSVLHHIMSYINIHFSFSSGSC